MDPAILAAITVVLSLVVYAWHRFFYDYEISDEHVCVKWLGITVRRIHLRDIETISKRRKHSGENWANTWRPRHRILVLRRRSGWRKDFVFRIRRNVFTPTLPIPRSGDVDRADSNDRPWDLSRFQDESSSMAGLVVSIAGPHHSHRFVLARSIQ